MHNYTSHGFIFTSREILDGLRKRGFKLSLDHRDAKFLFQGCTREGGYYLGKQHLLVIAPETHRAKHRRWRESANH
jgi:hypothetical protein